MQLKDLSGQKFGKWTVLYRIICTRKQTIWKCRCECGIEKDVYATHLIQGNSKGCIECFTSKNSGKNHKQFGGYEGISQSFWSSIKDGASGRRGNREAIEFSITIEYAWNLYLEQNKKCALSGIDIMIAYRANRYTNRHPEHTASLDRIDSNKGYIIGNVQWVHKDINMMKRIYDQDYFIDMCTKIADYNKRKKNDRNNATVTVL